VSIHSFTNWLNAFIYSFIHPLIYTFIIHSYFHSSASPRLLFRSRQWWTICPMEGEQSNIFSCKSWVIISRQGIHGLCFNCAAITKTHFARYAIANHDLKLPMIPGWNLMAQEILPLHHPDPHGWISDDKVYRHCGVGWDGMVLRWFLVAFLMFFLFGSQSHTTLQNLATLQDRDSTTKWPWPLSTSGPSVIYTVVIWSHPSKLKEEVC